MVTSSDVPLYEGFAEFDIRHMTVVDVTRTCPLSPRTCPLSPPVTPVTFSCHFEDLPLAIQKYK